MHRLIIIARCAEENFSDILSEAPIIYSDKVRLDTAPHHRHLSTYPRHMHMRKEADVVEDTITDINGTVEENVKHVLQFVRRELKI